MKKLNYLLITIALAICFICGCSKAEEKVENNIKDPSIILEANNKYLEVTDLDYSECILENDIYSCNINYVLHTSSLYDESYKDYYYRKIVFEFLDKDGNVIGEDSTYDNYTKTGESYESGSVNILINTSKEVKSIIVSKFELIKE